MASKTTKTAIPTPSETASIDSVQGVIMNSGSLFNVDEVWANVQNVSQRLGIDTKMAIDLMQLTNQVNSQIEGVTVFVKNPNINA